MEFLSPEWRQLVKFTMSEANRLGLVMSMNLSTSGGSLKAPWDAGANAPKKLTWTASSTNGPGRFEADLVKPDRPHFWDVALLAVRHGSPGTAEPESRECGAVAELARDRLRPQNAWSYRERDPGPEWEGKSRSPGMGGPQRQLDFR
jgi:hypothetical protein